jgi:hypothetical protein
MTRRVQWLIVAVLGLGLVVPERALINPKFTPVHTSSTLAQWRSG